MREFFDLFVCNKDCVAFGEKLGYKKVCFNELKLERGGSLRLNQAIVRKKGVQILLDPVTPKAKEFDTAIAQVAKDNGVAIGISLAQILDAVGPDRVRLLKNLFHLIKICKKMKNDVVIVSGARNVYEMRAPKELASIGVLIGLSELQALWAISEVPKAIVEGSK